MINDTDLALKMKALAHPARLTIIRFLSSHERCIYGDISNELPLAKSTVSQHLNKLKEAQLITGEIEGLNTCYCLNGAGLNALFDAIGEIKTKVNDQINCC